MALPELPAEREKPWFEKRNAFDNAVRAELEGRLSESELSATFATPDQVASAIEAIPARLPNATALRRFRAALAARDTLPVDILTIGHSFMEGVGSSSIAGRMQNRLIANLRQRWQPSGVTGGLGFIPARFLTGTPFTDNPLGTVGDPSGSDLFGLGRRSELFAPDLGISKLITAPMTGLDILYAKGPSVGNFEWKVDGGPATPVLGSAATVTDSGVAQVRALASGSHTVQVLPTAGTTVLDGFMVYNGDEARGIRLWDGARSAKGSPWFTDPAALYWLDRVPAVAPDLVVITLVRNDWALGVPSATTLANLQALVSNIRDRAAFDPSFVLCLEPNPSIIGPSASVEPWDNYVAAAKELVGSDPGVALFDMDATMGAIGADFGLWDADNIHPSQLGHQFWADQLAEFLASA